MEQRIRVGTPSYSYDVVVGGALRTLPSYIDSSDAFALVDAQVARLHGGTLPVCPTMMLEGAEAAKHLGSLPSIYRWLLAQGAHRKSTLLAIGGGAVCDVAGFVAATYMRGIRLGLAPTTLLAQVDAAVGGKNGLNLDGYKNIVGTFNQPSFVLCDPAMLRTLPLVELRSGLAEMVKCAIIADAHMFERMEAQADEVGRGNINVLLPLIADAVRIKSRIVSADEREAGLRRVLNLGHTWGHALEAVTGLPHGLCVSVGVDFAARLSVRRGLLSPNAHQRIRQLLTAMGLPVSAQADEARALEALRNDKKRHGGAVDFVLICDIGQVVVESIDYTDIQTFVLS
ncbi:MAG: 3-dehydroquinate synthase [Bacteroidales bacterium]|nr:3-dehydroquinate synthase [Bacteroidales bacterium]